MENSQSFYEQLSSFNRSGLDLSLRESEKHETTLADTRALLEKFRNDYKFLYSSYSNLKAKMDKLYQDGHLDLTQSNGLLQESNVQGDSGVMAVEHLDN